MSVALATALATALAACAPGSTEARPGPLRVVFVAWPGRPVSDAIEREVLTDARVQAALAGLAFERTTVDRAPPPLREALPGTGIVALRDAEIVGVLKGAVSARRLAAFVERTRVEARLAGAERDPLERARALLELGLPTRALAVLDRAVLDPRAALELSVEAHLALGEVAAARETFDRSGAVARSALVEATILVAERRPRDAVAVLQDERSAGHRERDRAVVLGRALLDCGDRQRAYALLEPVAAAGGEDRWAIEAQDLLAGAIFGAHGHVHR